jgi:hypothetical protein
MSFSLRLQNIVLPRLLVAFQEEEWNYVLLITDTRRKWSEWDFSKKTEPPEESGSSYLLTH